MSRVPAKEYVSQFDEISMKRPKVKSLETDIKKWGKNENKQDIRTTVPGKRTSGKGKSASAFVHHPILPL